MAGVVSALLRAGLAVKLGHLRQATASYVSDRVDQSRATLSGYAVGAGFYVAAGLFLIAALLVGAAALFRWVEITYGLFTAFGATAGALVVCTVICAIIAAASMRPKKAAYPSLGSRLSAALHASPAKAVAARKPSLLSSQSQRTQASVPDHVGSARKTATSVLRASPAPKTANASLVERPVVKSVGAAAAVGLLGWALSRRYSRPAPPPTSPKPGRRRH